MNDGAQHLRVVLVEDEAAQRRQLSSWLAADKSLTVVGEAASGRDAIAIIDGTRPDLVLLDIALPELSGLDVLRELSHPAKIVFTTAHRDYAIEAFELGAVDYLLKPFGPQRLGAAISRVRNRLPDPSDESRAVLERVESMRDEGAPLARVFVRDKNAIVPIPVESIVRLEADGDFTAVIAGSRRYLIGVTLQALHARIRRPDFVRVHRQHIVNLAFVSRFVPHDAGRLRIEFSTGGASIVASRGGSQLLRGLAG
jgi:two-component system LytT family response regulator